MSFSRSAICFGSRAKRIFPFRCKVSPRFINSRFDSFLTGVIVTRNSPLPSAHDNDEGSTSHRNSASCLHNAPLQETHAFREFFLTSKPASRVVHGSQKSKNLRTISKCNGRCVQTHRLKSNSSRVSTQNKGKIIAKICLLINGIDGIIDQANR